MDVLRLREPKIGEKLKDGSVYVGVSPHTNHPIQVLFLANLYPVQWMRAVDLSRALEFGEARQNWRLPTMAELERIRLVCSNVRGTYWAGAPHYLFNRWSLDFATGEAFMGKRSDFNFVCCVRGEDPYVQK